MQKTIVTIFSIFIVKTFLMNFVSPQKMSPIVSVDTGSRCMESRPCEHDCVVKYADNSTREITMSGWSLVTNKYFSFLDDPHHFLSMKKFLSQLDDDEYSEFKTFLDNFMSKKKKHTK